MIPDLLPDSDPLLHRPMPVFDFEETGAMARASQLEEILIAGMNHHDGIGLSANQVGIEQRAFSMETRNGAVVLFNPLVTWVSSETVKIKEGCLSFPEMELSISRPKECQVRYLNSAGEVKVLDLAGLECRTALHEIDHLDGITFTSRVSRLRLQMAQKRAMKRQ